jgi:hypothetical protein
MSDPVSDLKHELLAAAERRQGHAPARGSFLRRRAHLGRGRLLLLSATLFTVAGFALLFTAPWSNSPSFLSRAEAALLHDAGVLHVRWEDKTTSTDPGCTVTRGPNEVWIDETPPYRYRAMLYGFPPDQADADPGTTACSHANATELGGTFDPLKTVRFVPPDTLRDSSLLFKLPPDPVRVFREAISEGRAHDEGETLLDGRTVRRIRVDPPSDCPGPGCPDEPTDVYVDPETFHPVEIRGPAGVGKPLWIVTRYLTFEYLPRTAANLALTDIQAQHPTASN